MPRNAWRSKLYRADVQLYAACLRRLLPEEVAQGDSRFADRLRAAAQAFRYLAEEGARRPGDRAERFAYLARVAACLEVAPLYLDNVHFPSVLADWLQTARRSDPFAVRSHSR